MTKGNNNESINKNKKENIEHAVKFLLFSMSAGIIQVISFTLIYEIIKLSYWPSYLIALILSVVWNFTLNRKFTFKSAANVPAAMTKILIYYAIFTPITTWGGNLLEIAGVNAYLILFPTMILNLVTEFIVTKYIVYKNQINTAVLKSSE